jgi:hypothetical protein
VTGLPRHLHQTFEVAAAELGFCSAAWLFAREAARRGGDALVTELRDALGREFPVLDFVAERWIAGERAPRVDAAAVATVCGGAARLLVAGLETDHLDALVPVLPGVRIGIVADRALPVDTARVVANYPRHVEAADLDSFQEWAGRRSVLLAFAYGVAEGRAYVAPPAVRMLGPDTRVQFRAIVAWDVLGRVPYLYPRWLVEVSTDEITEVVRG